MIVPTLKEYLQTKQFTKKFKKHITECSATQRFTSEKEEKFTHKIIQIKAKLDMYVNSQRGKKAMEMYLDELLTIFKDEAHKQWKNQANQQHLLLGADSVTFQNINNNLENRELKNKAENIPKLSRKFSLQFSEEHEQKQNFDTTPSFQPNKKSHFSNLLTLNRQQSQSANCGFFNLEKIQQQNQEREKSDRRKEEKSKTQYFDQQKRGQNNDQKVTRKKIEYYREELQKVKKQRERRQRLKTMATDKSNILSAYTEEEERNQISMTQSTTVRTQRRQKTFV